MTQAMRFDVDALDRASAVFLKVAQAVERLEKKLKDLDRTRVDVQIDADTKAAERKVDELKRKLATLSNQRVRIDLDVGDARQLSELRRALEQLRDRRIQVNLDVRRAAQLTNLARQLRQLRNANIRVDVNIGGSEAKIGRLVTRLTALRSMSPIEVRINVDGADAAQQTIARLHQRLSALPNVVRLRVHLDIQPPGARAQLLALKALLQSLRGTTHHQVNVDVDKNSLGALGRLGAGLAKSRIAAIAAGIAIGASTQSFAGLAYGVVAATGSLGLLPGALAAASVAAATLVVGVTGVGKALKETDPEKLAEELKKLAPAAQDFVKQVRDLGPAFHGLRLDVQEKLFAGLGEETKKLGHTYLPVLKTGMGGIATQLGGFAKDFVGFATSIRSISDTATGFRNTAAALQAARPAAVNLASAFRDIAVVGSSMLPGLAAGFSNVTARFATFIAHARQTGQLREWIQGGLDALQKLGSIAGNVGSALASVFRAATASGADFLTRLDQITEGIARFLKSAQGQSALTTWFSTIRATIDALLPGLQALGLAAVQMISAFANTGALQAAGRVLSEIATAIAPLGATIGNLAGGALRNLASGLSLAATAASPVVGALNGIVGALGPIAPAALAALVAFKSLGAVGAKLSGLGASVAATAAKWGLYTTAVTGSMAAGGAANTVVTRLGGAIQKMGAALPFVGVALIGIGAAAEAASVDYEGLTQKVAQGALTMGQAITQAQQQATTGFAGFVNGVGDLITGLNSGQLAADGMRTSVDEYRASLGPMQQLQFDVTRAQGELNDAIVRYGEGTPQAVAATDNFIAANGRLKDAQDQAGDAAKTHAQKLQELADTMNAQIGSALAYEQAVLRTAEANKQAGEALKKSGADSNEYKQAVLDLAGAMVIQADAARAQGEALGGTEAGVKAFNTEILRAADVSTTQGRDAFIKIASAMDDAGRASLSAAAKMSGLRTEVITLPDGKTVTVVVNADRAKLDTVQQELRKLQTQKYVGTVTIDGDARPFQDKILQGVTLANGSHATMTIDGNGKPLEIQVGQNKYKIDSTTGTMQIDGNPAPGTVSLNGFKLTVDQTTGLMKIDADPALAQGKIQAAVDLGNGMTAVITLDGNPSPVDGKIHGSVALADGSTGTITLEGNPDPATGKITAVVSYGNGQHTTIQIDPRDLATPAINAIPRTVTVTVNIRANYTGFGAVGGPSLTRAAHGGAGGGLVTPVRMARGGVIGGYQPGRDTVPAVLSRGEAVLVPELVRQIGPANILAANAAASGRPPTFWSGGGVARFANGGMAGSRWASSPGAVYSRPAGGDSGALLPALHELNGQLRALRGDVDHHGDNASIVVELRAVRGQLARLASGASASASAQAARTTAELGAF